MTHHARTRIKQRIGKVSNKRLNRVIGGARYVKSHNFKCLFVGQLDGEDVGFVVSDEEKPRLITVLTGEGLANTLSLAGDCDPGRPRD